MTRIFDKMIPLSAGDYSKNLIDMLKKRLDDGIDLLCALQQPGHPDSKEAWHQELILRSNDEESLRDMVRDIAMALTGENITFGSENTLNISTDDGWKDI